MGTGRGRRASARGFTLIEAAMTTVIIGVGVVAMVEAQQAFLVSNAWSNHTATGTFLANEIREMSVHLPRHDPVTGLQLVEGEDTDLLQGWGPEAGEVVVADFDDIDDFDGLEFSWVGTEGHGDGDLPGPIDGFGNVIPETTASGGVSMTEPEEGEDAAEVPMSGWRQRVIVEKVEPYDTGLVRADGYADGVRAVDEFPLRVTVLVSYEGAWELEPIEVTRVSWIVP